MNSLHSLSQSSEIDCWTLERDHVILEEVKQVYNLYSSATVRSEVVPELQTFVVEIHHYSRYVTVPATNP